MYSNDRLDYEEQSIYSLRILIEDDSWNCSFSIRIELINIADSATLIDRSTLYYRLDPTRLAPFYVGRIKFFRLDNYLPSDFNFDLKNSSTNVKIDAATGSIFVDQQMNRHDDGRRFIFELVVINTIDRSTIEEFLLVDIDASRSLFEKELNFVTIPRSTPIGSEIFRVRNSNEKRKIFYSLIDSREEFEIDEKNGTVRLVDFLPFSIRHLTLIVEGQEENHRSRMTIEVSIEVNDELYFDFNVFHRCQIDSNATIGTTICTVGKNSSQFFYQLVDPSTIFDLRDETATIVNQKTIPNDFHQEEFFVKFIVKSRSDREKSPILSMLNLTIVVVHHQTNSKRFFYVFYPSINSIIDQMKIDFSDFHQEIRGNDSSFYRLRKSIDSTDLILQRSIDFDCEHFLIVDFSKKSTTIEFRLDLIYRQMKINSWSIQPRSIDVYLDENVRDSSLNLGRISLIDHFPLQRRISFYLMSEHSSFFLKEISKNQSELFYRPSTLNISESFQLKLAVITVEKSILTPNDFVRFPPSTPFQTIDVRITSINRSLRENTVVLDVNIHSEQQLIKTFSYLRQRIADLIDVHQQLVHLYSYEIHSNHYEILLSTPSNKEKLNEILQLSSNQLNSSINDRCPSSFEWLTNVYVHLSDDNNRFVLPKFRWKNDCRSSNENHFRCLNQNSAICRSKKNEPR